MTTQKIGFIGLGSMGGDQAKRLIANGADLTVYDVYPPSREAFEGKATIAPSIKELAQTCEIVSICVRDDQQVKDTLEGSEGLLDNMAPHSIILIHSTIKPETVLDLAQKAAEKNIDLVDAPVSRTRHTSDGPFVAVMFGGTEAALERATPVLEAYATNIFHAGPLGSGASMKIINNMITWTHISTFAQAMLLADKADVKLDTFMELLASNGNLTPTTKAFSAGFLGQAANKEFAESQAGIGEKDLSLAMELANRTGTEIPVAEQTKAYVRKAMVRD